MKDNDYLILEAMTIYGGSFVKTLAWAAQRADSENYAKLKAAFPELWDSYAAFVRKND